MSKGTQQIRLGRVDTTLNKLRNRLHNFKVEFNTMILLGATTETLREHKAKIDELEETLGFLEKEFGL